MRTSSSQLRFFALIIGVLLFSITLTGCKKDYTSRMDNVLEAMRHGETEIALENIEVLVDRAERNKKPERNHLTLLLLERGTIHLANGNFAEAAADFNAADQMLEILDLTPQGARKAAAAMFSGTAVVYHAPIYEKLMVNIVGLATYLSLNQLGPATVEARRLIVLTEYFTNAGYEKHPALSLAYALAGYALDRSGEASAARRLYEAAIKIDGSSFATEALRRMRGGDAPGDAELVVLVLSGRGPLRVPEALPIGLLLGWINDDFPLSPSEHEIIGGFSAEEALGVIRFPVMQTFEPAFTHWTAQPSQNSPTSLALAADTNAFAEQQWRELRPAIAMTAISRFLTRHVAQTAMAATGDAVGGIGGGILRLAGLAAKGAMMAADTPDTRAWNTIPGYTFLGHVPVQETERVLYVTGDGPGGRVQHHVPLEVRSGSRMFKLVYSVH